MIKIGHFFVHSAVESEYMKQFGEIYAFGLNCKTDRNVNHFIECDLEDFNYKFIPENFFDFGLFHPPCQKFSKATKNPNEHKNLIPLAREIAKHSCKYYVIENVSKAPLKNPIFLNGKMFNKSMKYERAFETNYNIKQPFRDTSDYDYKRENGVQYCSSYNAMKIKEYEFMYDSITMVRNCLPKPYVKYLMDQCPL